MREKHHSDLELGARSVLEALRTPSQGSTAHVHDVGTLTSPANRLVLFGREGMGVRSVLGVGPSANQILADRFIDEQNSAMQLRDRSTSHAYVSMTCMEAGRTLRRLCLMDTPLEIRAGNSTFYAGTFEGNSALIDRVGRRCVEQASGVVTCASMHSAPDSYFRCVEYPAIRTTHAITGIRVLSTIANSERDGDFAVKASKVYRVGDWAYAQKDQWWASTLDQLSSLLTGIPALPQSMTDRDINLSKARFIGEIFHASRDIAFLKKQRALSGTRLELHREYARLAEALAFIDAYPDAVNPRLTSTVTLVLARMFAYDLPPDANERRFVIGSDPSRACTQFVRDSIIRLIQKVHECGSVSEHSAFAKLSLKARPNVD